MVMGGEVVGAPQTAYLQAVRRHLHNTISSRLGVQQADFENMLVAYTHIPCACVFVHVHCV
jgi:hypothetical protein